MIINTNMTALVSAHDLESNETSLTESISRLSSGSKIVNPSDDAAGLAEASRLNAQIRRLGAAENNVSNAVSFTQTQDGYLNNIGNALNRMSELSVLALDETKSDGDRALYQDEYAQLSSYINDTATKEFNGVSLFSSNSLSVTIDSEGNSFAMQAISLGAAIYANAVGADVSTVADAQSALTKVKLAITQLSQDRATIGSYQSRLNSTSDQLSVSSDNLTAASSQIEDVDVAQESTTYARENILVQSGTAMLAQANKIPQSILQLLQP